MEKKFLKTSLLLVMITSILSVVFSVIYFVVYIKVKEGQALFNFLGYTRDTFNAIATFTCFGSIIYAVAKFDFKVRTWTLGIVILGYIPYFIFQISTWIPYLEHTSGLSVSSASDFSQYFYNGMHDFIGQGVVSQLIPTLIVLLLAVVIIKDKYESPSKVISWSNMAQRTMIISSLVVAAISLLSFFFISMLPVMIDHGFVFKKGEFGDFMSSFGRQVLMTLILNVLACYIIEMILFKVYDKVLNK